MKDSNFKKKVVGGVAWSAVQTWGGQAMAFLVFWILSRLLAPEAFGLVALASVFVGFFQLIVDLGISDAIVQRSEIDRFHLDTAFWTAIGIGVGLFALTMITADYAAVLLDESELAPILKVLSLNFVITGFSSTQMAILRRNLAFRTLAIRTLIGTIGGAIVGISMAILDYGAWSLVGQSLTVSFVSVVTLWTVSSWRPKLNWSFTRFRELFGFGMHVATSKIVVYVGQRGGDLLIGAFLNTTQLGYYSIGRRFVMTLLNLLNGVITVVAFPVFARLRSNQGRIKDAFYLATEYTAVLAFPVFVGVMVTAGELVPLMFGAKWLPSVPVTRITALLALILSVSTFNGEVIKAYGKSAWLLLLAILATVSVNVLVFVVIDRGIDAIAWAYVVRYIAILPLSYWMVARVISIEMLEYFRRLAPVAVASGIMAIAVLLIKVSFDGVLSNAAILTVEICTGILAYLICIRLLKPETFSQMVNMLRVAGLPIRSRV